MIAGGPSLKHRSLRKCGFLISIIFIIAICACAFFPGAGAPIARAANATQAVQPVYINPGLLKLNGLAVTLAVNPASIDMSKTASVNATVTYSNGTPADGAVITLTCSPAGGTFGQSSFTASSKIIYTQQGLSSIHVNSLTTTFQAKAGGSYNITATATKDGFATGTASQVINVIGPAPVSPTPNPATPTPTAAPVVPTPTIAIPSPTAAAAALDISPYIPYIAIVVVLLLLVILVVLYLWFKRSLRVIPKAQSVRADGSSAVPIKIMFVNGLGMVRKPGNDTEIELTATSGTIKPVVLNAGKDFAETSLVSSKEFGTVSILAKAGSRTGKASVAFACEKPILDIAASPATIPADGKSSATVIVRVKDSNGNFVAPLEERNVELTTNLGKVTTPVKMPARSTATATITSGDVIGTVVITASSGDLKGEGRMEFESKAKRFCMHCGATMSMDAVACPKCGLTPPSGVDTKLCATCGTVLPEAAKFCYSCGARQADIKPEAAPAATVKKPDT